MAALNQKVVAQDSLNSSSSHSFNQRACFYRYVKKI
jgi:hypothetical protein